MSSLFPFDQPGEQCAGPITAVAILHKMHDVGCEHIARGVQNDSLQSNLFAILFSQKAANSRLLLVQLAAMFDERYGILLRRAFNICCHLNSASRLRSLAFINNVISLNPEFLSVLEPYWSAVGSRQEIELVRTLMLSPTERGCLDGLYPISYPTREDMEDCGISQECPSMIMLADAIIEHASSVSEDSEQSDEALEDVIAMYLPGLRRQA